MASTTTPRPSPLPLVARPLALFLGGFSLLNLLGDLLTPNFDANEWWIDLHRLSRPVADCVLVLTSGLLVAWAVRPFRHKVAMRFTTGALVVLLAIVAGNMASFYALMARGIIRPAFPVPFSALIAAALVVILLAIRAPARRLTRRTLPLSAGIFLLTLVLFPLAQVLCFGGTDYRRRADAIVVPGARVYADGTMSTAVLDRTRTAVDLYLAGYAPLLVFSGGPGDGLIDEPSAMRNYAMSRGVPAAAIVLDPDGLTTRRTAANTAALFRGRGIARALVVSQAWHLPRAKLAFQREGVQAFTVPAREPRPLAGRHYLTVREVPALWTYYLRPLIGV